MTDRKKIDKLIERAISVRENSPRVALEKLERALKLAQEAQYKKGEGLIFQNLGRVYIVLSDYKESISSLHSALTIFEELNDVTLKAEVLNSLGMCYCYLGNFADGLNYLKKSLALAEELSNDSFTAKILNNVGNCYYAMDDLESAKTYYLKSLPLKEKLNDIRGLGACYNNLALISMGLKNISDGEEYIKKALEIKQKFTETLKDEASLAFSKTILGSVKRAQKDFAVALNIFEEVLHTYLKQNNKLMLCEIYALIAATYLEINDIENALKALNAGEEFVNMVKASRITDEFAKLHTQINEMKNRK